MTQTPLESRRYPVGAPDLGEEEIARVTEAMRSTWISSAGTFLDEFESTFAQACGVGHAVAVANGTVALHLILAALGIGRGDEVIVPSLTYIATANTVTYTGATPVFCDVDADNWCLDPDSVRAAITPRTAAIVAVHLYGHPADMDALRALADEHGLALVEDAAEAPFATYRGTSTGGLGTAASFSFYGNKIITSGEGGAVTTNDPELASRMRLLRGQGMDPARRYFFPVIGYNYRLTNIAAAILCGQMARREELWLRRERIYAVYDGCFELEETIQRQVVEEWATRAPWMYSVALQGEQAGRRDDVMASMAEVGVETRPLFIPLHRLPPYASPSSPDLPVTGDLAARGLSLPTTSVMTEEDAAEVARRFLKVLGS
jgi:perosamine synthetase